jgi:hypothetical protein
VTLDEFDKGMRRLEAVFNHGKELQGDARGEYIEALRFLGAGEFEEAMTMVIATFKPFPSEPFPSVFTIQDAVTMIQSENGIYKARRERGATDTAAADFCQRCQNSGLHVGADGQAQACQCERGRMKRASWPIGHGTRRREARIQEVLDKLPSSKGPVRGLMEKNALGFWESNAVEHEEWVKRKQEQIRALEAREAERKSLAPSVRPRTIDREALKQAVAATKARAEERAAEIEEEDGIPF